MAPAMLLAQGADWVDLDGPLLLARDREPALRYDGALVHPPEPRCGGDPRSAQCASLTQHRAPLRTSSTRLAISRRAASAAIAQ